MSKRYIPGIIETLQKKYSLDEFLVYNSSSLESPYRGPNNAFNYENTEKFESSPLEEPFFYFGFKNMSITLVSYKIRSSINAAGFSHLKKWDFYGSNDAVNWELIDRRENIDILNGALSTGIFKIERPINPFSHYMISNTTSHYMEKKIMFSAFDVYDIMLDSYHFYGCITAKCKKSFSDIRTFVLLTLCLIIK